MIPTGKAGDWYIWLTLNATFFKCMRRILFFLLHNYCCCWWWRWWKWKLSCSMQQDYDIFKSKQTTYISIGGFHWNTHFFSFDVANISRWHFSGFGCFVCWLTSHITHKKTSCDCVLRIVKMLPFNELDVRLLFTFILQALL